MSKLRLAPFCLLVVASMSGMVFGQGDGTFLAEVSFPLNDLGAAFRAADLNGDGDPDLAATGGVGEVFVFLNRDGVLEAQPQSFPAGNSLLHLVAEDLTGDGVLDLVATDSGADSVAVLIGVGDGTFGQATTHRVGGGPRQSEVADFDQDGNPDIAVLNNLGGDLSLLKGDGDGGFADAESMELGLGPHAMVVDDFNEDEWPDLAVALGDESSLKLIYFGEGGTTERSFEVGLVPRALAGGDFDDDGNADVAVANQNSENIMVFMGDGNGGLALGPTVPLGSAPDQLFSAHFDDDGQLDLAVVVLNLQTFDGELRILLSNDVGGYDLTPFNFTLPGMLVVSVEDLDLDGVTDLALGSTGTTDVNLVSGRGDGSFLGRTILGTGVLPRSVAAGDLNGDQELDLISANSQDGNLSFYAGRGDGTFVDREDITSQGASFHSVVAADFDGTAAWDLAAANFAGGGRQRLPRGGRGYARFLCELPHRAAAGPGFGRRLHRRQRARPRRSPTRCSHHRDSRRRR